jgi:gluconolactonase
MVKSSRLFLSALAVFVVVGGCAALAQQPVTPTVPVSQGPADQRKATRPFELHALTPEFWEVFDKNATLTTMGTGFGFTEGPVWDQAGFLWVSDESKNQIDKLYEDGRVENMVSLVDPDGSTYDRQNRLLSPASGLRAIIRLSVDGKSFETVVDHYHGKKLNTPNDIVIGPDGAIYFTDPIIDMTKDQQEELPPSVYRLGADNTMSLLTTDLKAPNGLAFSPNGKYLYIDDDNSMKIRRYKFHKDGTISDGMDFADMSDPLKRGVPDGMKVDVKGRLFVSGPTGIWVWNSKGVHIGTVQMPRDMANLTWGGPENSKLYITASDTVYILQTKTRGILGYTRK